MLITGVIPVSRSEDRDPLSVEAKEKRGGHAMIHPALESPMGPGLSPAAKTGMTGFGGWETVLA
jgi:hypothetical protein